MRFEWDERKNLSNIRDHKIDFQDVPPVFQGPVLIDLDDRKDYGEDRWIGIGMLRSNSRSSTEIEIVFVKILPQNFIFSRVA